MKWESMTLKGVLAFFLVTVAAIMVLIWMLCVFILRSTIDAGMAALLASFVTMFIKMAADASGYQYTSSAGSDSKTDTQNKIVEKLTTPQNGTGGSDGAMKAAVAAAALAAPAAAAVAAPAAAAVAAPPAAAVAAPPVVNEVVPPAVKTAVENALAARAEVDKTSQKPTESKP